MSNTSESEHLSQYTQAGGPPKLIQAAVHKVPAVVRAAETLLDAKSLTYVYRNEDMLMY